MNRSFQQPYNFPTKNGEDGDSLLWASLLHASGEDHIDGILACQDESGRFWRSPARVKNDVKNSFSKDMATGLILAAMADSLMYDKSYIVNALQRWIDFVVSNRYQAFPSSDATDGRAIMTPAIFWAASYAGANVPTWLKATRSLLYPYLYIAAMFNKPGYTLHLVGVSLFTIQMTHGNWFTNKIAKVLYKRQSKNPFFAYLAGDYTAAADMTYKYYINSLYNNQGSRHQWGWEREDDEKAWKDSCGHDFVFISNLIKLTVK